MNDLDLRLEVVSRSCQPLRYIRRCISRKPLEIETWFQRTTNRKWNMGYQMVTWPMTSRDIERSNSWPQYAWSAISRKPLEIETPFQRTTNRKSHIGYQKWSRDQWRHVPQRCCVAVRSAILATAWLQVLVQLLVFCYRAETETRSTASLFIRPEVSIATGKKMWLLARPLSLYISFLAIGYRFHQLLLLLSVLCVCVGNCDLPGRGLPSNPGSKVVPSERLPSW